MPHYCDERECRYCEDLTCIAGNAYHVQRLCATYRKRPREPNYRELMQPCAGICQRERGRMKRR